MVRDLRRHYEKLERPEATRNLIAAIEGAWRTITTDPDSGLPAPRPYPNLTRPGRAWVQSGRYWIAFVTRPSVAIVAVVYDAADIPRRV
jgi:plasmid stabilization system protein ParE